MSLTNILLILSNILLIFIAFSVNQISKVVEITQAIANTKGLNIRI